MNNPHKLDVLAFGAHPDDVELSAGATLIKLSASGKKTGIVDLTMGELGSRGSGELRLKEASKAAEIMGLSARENLKLADGFFEHDKPSLLAVVRMIRKYQPEIVLANAVSDRHPDHAKGAKLVAEACFLAGLLKIETKMDGKAQGHWRPQAVYHYIQDHYIKPDIAVDVSDFVEQKMEAILAYGSQFYDPNSDEPETPISGKEFLDFIRSRMVQFGRPIGAQHAEGFTVQRTPGVNSLFDLR